MKEGAVMTIDTGFEVLACAGGDVVDGVVRGDGAAVTLILESSDA
jgi:hypothetical protein